MNPSSDDYRDDALDQAIALDAGLLLDAPSAKPEVTVAVETGDCASSSQEIVVLSQPPEMTRSEIKPEKRVAKRSVADALKASLERKAAHSSGVKRERARSPTQESSSTRLGPKKHLEDSGTARAESSESASKRIKQDHTEPEPEKGLGNMLFEWTPESAAAPLDPSRTLHAFGVGSSKAEEPEGWVKPDEDWMPPGMGGVKQTRIGRAGGDVNGKGGYKAPKGKPMEFKNNEEVNRYLLKTLGQESNPITNSDLYSRTAHVISASTGHQVSQRGASKFCMPNQTYMQRRNQKLKEQFTARVPDPVAKTEEMFDIDKGEGTAKTGRSGGYHAEGGMAPRADEAEGALGQGEAFEPWIIGGNRPKRVGVGDLQSRIFAGCTVYINGYTGPRISDLELKRLIALHGGNVSYHCTSACTHILVVKGLSGTKSQKFLDSSSSTRAGKRKVVHVDWALDSVAQGKKLSETPYNVITNKSQPTLMSALQAKD